MIGPRDARQSQLHQQHLERCLDLAIMMQALRGNAEAQTNATKRFVAWVEEGDDQAAQERRLECLARAVRGEPMAHAEGVISAAKDYDKLLSGDDE